MKVRLHLCQYIFYCSHQISWTLIQQVMGTGVVTARMLCTCWKLSTVLLLGGCLPYSTKMLSTARGRMCRAQGNWHGEHLAHFIYLQICNVLGRWGFYSYGALNYWWRLYLILSLVFIHLGDDILHGFLFQPLWKLFYRKPWSSTNYKFLQCVVYKFVLVLWSN